MRKLNLSKSEANKSPHRTKSFLAMLVLALGLFLGMAEEGKATCQSGYYPTTITMTVNGCAYDVQICYRCILTSGQPNWAYISEYSLQNPSCTQTWTSDEVWAALNADLLNHVNDLCSLPPCNGNLDDYRLWKVIKYICWRKKLVSGKVIYYVPDPSSNESCGDATCVFIYRACWNGTTTVLVNAGYPNYYLVGTPTCSSANSSEPLNSTLVNNGPSSPCFYRPNPCSE